MKFFITCLASVFVGLAAVVSAEDTGTKILNKCATEAKLSSDETQKLNKDLKSKLPANPKAFVNETVASLGDTKAKLYLRCVRKASFEMCAKAIKMTDAEKASLKEVFEKVINKPERSATDEERKEYAEKCASVLGKERAEAGDKCLDDEFAKWKTAEFQIAA